MRKVIDFVCSTLENNLSRGLGSPLGDLRITATVANVGYQVLGNGWAKANPPPRFPTRLEYLQRIRFS